ncbi:hypothetical protein GCM10011494_26630 [Novosphingobium endophyticum]|uniref:Major facilitator superfamily (MFS) profile domain-containing protein n=1 Tax=Novosphingobium endophyticum TaxID=1955250 RepID=A0A916TW70_9SPHN|nr:hypothetical protein GCM10011494_26630 [Novosphingobium endophyticum]
MTAVRSNWLQIGIATLTQNFATGLAFGSFGTLVLAIEHEYAASRAQSSLAISLLVISLSITASLLGRILETVSIRMVATGGAILAACGFGLASVVQEAWQFMAVYGLILGPATAMLGLLPSMTHATRWSNEHQRGLALGIVNMPILVMIVPLVIAPLLLSEGIRYILRVLAIADLCLIPVMLLVMRDANVDKRDALEPGDESVDGSHILRSPVFWLLVAGQGILAGAGTMKLAHFIPLLTEQGRSFAEANLLLAISGGAGLLGSFAFGALADRVGGAKALVLNAILQAVMWTIFLMPVSFPVLLADAVVVGACGGGIQAAFGVVLSTVFGQKHFSRALGLVSLFTLPFLFGLTPAASLLYEATGNYHLPMGLMVAGFLVAAAIFMFASPRERHVTRTTLKGDLT